MKKITLLALAFSLTAISTYAKEKEPEETPSDRPSSLSLEGLAGRHQFVSTDLSAEIGLNHVYAVTGKINVTQSDENSRSLETRIGGNAKLNPDIKLKASVFGRNEPNEVVTRGITPGVEWIISSNWQTKKQTTLFAEAELARYQQASGTAPSRALAGTFYEKTFTLGVGQEISEIWSFGLNFSSFQYTADTGRLSNATNNRQLIRKDPQGNIDVSGFAKNSLTLSTEISPWMDWRFGMGITSTKYVGSRTQTLNVNTQYSPVESWEFGLLAGVIKASKETIGGYAGLNLSYL